jgi:hypothetical protein
MKNVKRLSLGFSLGLALALSSVGFASNTLQTTQTTKTESCCSMACCKDGSCSMKDHAKKNHAKDHSAKDDCCGSGDSCNMKSHDSAKNHAAKEGCCCSGDSCSTNHEMKDHAQGEKNKEHTMDPTTHAAIHSDKDGCCCCGGDSCNLKLKDKQ